MALKNCKECGKQVSTKADTCPNCGVKNPTKKTISKFWIGLFNISMLFFFGWLIFGGEAEDTSSIKPTADGFTKISLNVREGPSTDFDVITALKAGEQIRFIEDSLGWYKVRTIERDDKISGWVSSNYISDIAEYETWVKNQEKKQERKTQREEANAWRTEDNSTMAYVMCEKWVKDRLKAPSTAEFQSVWDGRYDNTFKNGTTYQITSYVDAENSFGANLRMGFTCETKQTSQDEWQLLSLEIDN